MVEKKLKKPNCINRTFGAGIPMLVSALYLAGTSLPVFAGTEDYANQGPLAAEFKKLDVNHDNKLSREEASHDQDLVGNFDRADTNADGALVASEYSTFKSSAQQKRVEGFLDDSTVTAKVKAELLKDIGMKGLKISVETYKGQVILSGFVDTDKQLRRAVEIASGIRGVQSVKNGLVVKS